MQSAFLLLLALFAQAPIFSSCVVSLLYSLYLFLTNESSSVHHAQEFENRFWTIFAVLFSTAFFFARDSPFAFGRMNPTSGFFGVVFFGYAMHAWNRYVHRQEISKSVRMMRRNSTASKSLDRLNNLGVPIEKKLERINSCLRDIDQLLLPSTINNFINQRFVLRKEKEIINTFEEADPKELNFLVSHVQLGLLFYKIKDHRNFAGQHRTELIDLLAVNRISNLTVVSRVIVLHSLMIMKLPANSKSEHWVRNIILSTHQDDLSELKTLTDSKGDYFCMNKLLYDDLRSESVRQDMLKHIRKEASIQEAHMAMGTRKAKLRAQKAWIKVLSDVDDTLTSSGGSYPAGIDKRYGKKVVYPGVLGFYRELDLGINGPEEWPKNTVGNLVFLSARPHLYKDVSERHNFAKFEKLRARGADDIRRGMHTIPSLLAGDLSSGRDFIVNNDMEPLSLKKFDNFKRYVSIYPEFKHVFVCDNGQGDVRAAELMFDAFPQHLAAVYVHRVQPLRKTHGYDGERYKRKNFKPYFFRTYPDAALHAAMRNPPLIKVKGLRRICQDAVADFYMISMKEWPSLKLKAERREELNQAIWNVNDFLYECGAEPVDAVEAKRAWQNGDLVRTPYGVGTVLSFDSKFDLYEVDLDWRPLDLQIAEHKEREARYRDKKNDDDAPKLLARAEDSGPTLLETVEEASEDEEEPSSSGNTNRNQGDDFVSSPTHSIDMSQSVRDEQVGIDKSCISTDDTSIQTYSNLVSKDNSALDIPGSVSSDQHMKDPALVEESIPETIGAAGDKNPEGIVARQGSTISVKAKIQGRLVQRYSAPEPPSISKKKKGQAPFSFWAEGKTDQPIVDAFKPGDHCATPYGPVTVIEYQKTKRIVVVEMIGWGGKAYLQQDCVQKVISETIWNSLMRRFNLSENKEIARPKGRELEFPYSVGTILRTPYGEGIISRPIPVPESSRRHLDDPPSTPLLKPHQGQHNTTHASMSRPQTLGVSLTNWSLTDESNPTLYCTLDEAREWKRLQEEMVKGETILNVVGSLMSRGLKRMTTTVDRPATSTLQYREKSVKPEFERYYMDGASVTTPYGNGVIKAYRVKDGIYEATLESWKMVGGKSPVVFLRKDDLSYCLAKGCHEGYPVLTSYGLTGILASVEPTTGVHAVSIPSIKMVCYLQPRDVIRPIKAAVGEEVATPYGEGSVATYRKSDDMYEISLKGTGANLFCKAETFDRIADMGDDDPSGLSRFLRYLWFSSDATADRAGAGSSSNSRSRSNSITSASGRSASSMSTTSKTKR